ncbi:MAG: hypothetical protein HC825_00950 [Oscillatoriales cyanobacterium RM1_1_9]|nr:hypothetical protein [Oscillatoriales cyanobacterium SM2_3_0]NJO70658.1 hypothetical protein [Oscillatoriales cyanobacterium RM1_1_9]
MNGWEWPQTAQPIAEQFQTYHLTHEFYHEVQQRDSTQAYCQWYAEMADSHQQEFKKMRGDFNLFGYFLRGFRA